MRLLQLFTAAQELTVCSYSAIDMSTFEALKLAYLRSTGKDEPGVLALLAFGSVSGSVGATSVYPPSTLSEHDCRRPARPDTQSDIPVFLMSYGRRTRATAGGGSIVAYYLH